MGKLCSKFGEDRSTNSVTILFTDAGRTPRKRDFVFCPMHCIALDRQPGLTYGQLHRSWLTRFPLAAAKF